MKMGLAPITTIGACTIFMIQGAALQHDQLYPFSAASIGLAGRQIDHQ
jgi:hypothetical protein